MNTNNVIGTYKTFKNIDGVYWLSLQPLINDLQNIFNNLEEGSLPQQQTAVVLLFLNSILAEAQLKDLVDPSEELSYKETLLQ